MLTESPTDLSERVERARQLVTDTKLANFAKMANMLIDLFGLEDAFEKYVKLERVGQVVEMEFPSLGGSLKFVLTRDKSEFEARVEECVDPEAKILIKVPREDATRVAGKIIRSKSNIFGLLKIIPMILTGKVWIKGSWMAALSLCRVLMVGKNDIYKEG